MEDSWHRCESTGREQRGRVGVGGEAVQDLRDIWKVVLLAEERQWCLAVRGPGSSPRRLTLSVPDGPP